MTSRRAPLGNHPARFEPLQAELEAQTHRQFVVAFDFGSPDRPLEFTNPVAR